MLVIHVFVHVKPESIEAFKAASVENAGNSVLKPGIARFDVIQPKDDPTRFVLDGRFLPRGNEASSAFASPCLSGKRLSWRTLPDVGESDKLSTETG